MKIKKTLNNQAFTVYRLKRCIKLRTIFGRLKLLVLGPNQT